MNKEQYEKACKSIGKYLASLTKRQRELVLEDFARTDYFQPLDDRRAKLQEKSRVAYEKAYYGTCWKSEKKREAFDFLRAWIGRTIWAQESGRPRPAGKLLRLLTPWLDARDADFFDGLAEAMRITDDRICNSKVQSLGIGDTHLSKWLLEYKIRMSSDSRDPIISWHPLLPSVPYTVRELNKQFVSKFRSISDAKLRAKCRELGIPLKEDVRGAGAVRRKMHSNGTRPAGKKD